MSFKNLQQLLRDVAAQDGSGQVICYPLGNTHIPATYSYRQLLQEAERASWALRARLASSLSPGSRVLLHFTSHWDNIVWFWATILAGCIPVMSTALPNSSSLRTAHLEHLSKTLMGPVSLSRENLVHEFDGQDAISPVNVELLDMMEATPTETCTDSLLSDTAVMMLTSGTTGHSKAVCLSHGQILTAIEGKLSVIPLPGKSFLNWIVLSHVAALIEIHLQAMLARKDQIHVHGPDVLTNPTEFINLIDKHRVSRTFAPNSFLAKIRNALSDKRDNTPQWDLRCLTYVASGGEANVTRTCEEVSCVLRRYGAPSNVIVPGFGMTETCAGAIFNKESPQFDKSQEFASVGSCMPGINMRITGTAGSETNNCLPPGEIGDLEVTGPVVFKEYFNNPKATADAFSNDGWFKTGDQGFIDQSGNLTLAGRVKDTIIINGLKYNPQEIESALDESGIPGLTPNFNCCFCSFPPGGETEEICVVYLPNYTPEDMSARVQTTDAIAKTVMMSTGSRPQIIPLDRSLLQRSALGKLPRGKIKASYEQGAYRDYNEINNEVVRLYRKLTRVPPQDEFEQRIFNIMVASIGLSQQEFSVNSPVFELGITSIELIKLKKNLEEHLDRVEEIPIMTIMMNPTVRGLSRALRGLQSSAGYSPVVILQSEGQKTPLWLFHPGVGEVLVFLNLAKFIRDRPVYALRARGFNEGEKPFASIEEAVNTYYAAIKEKQPNGPYALAGYSYGSMLAFEVGKMIEQYGDEVAFLGSFNLPPHIKSRMRQLDFKECLLHLSYFLDLMSEERARELAAELGNTPREETLEIVLQNARQTRLAELALSRNALLKWACLAFALQSMAIDYEPSGSITGIDVFYCIPLAVVATSKQQWREEHLSKWKDFTRSEPRFHDVGGAHYTMLSPDYVVGFQKVLRGALDARRI
ncbi:hypothetical protein BBP40_005835 [Aspergillus hancockii]|nr:hypothetical protein BBP40_005835 [Aspergillus hancockii]